MKKNAFSAPLFGAFLFGAALGSVCGTYFVRSCAFSLSLSSSGTDGFQSLLLPLLVVLFLGTSSLGGLLIPAVSFARGYTFSFTAAVLLHGFGFSRTAAELGLPGAFILTAFFLSAEAAMRESGRLERLPQPGKRRNILPIFLLLLLGAAFRTYFHTLF